MNNTIVVTGGAGFIGSNFVNAWVQQGLGKVINVDKLTYAGNLENLSEIQDNENHIFVQADIGDNKVIAHC
jgi:dTDP-glucose 4,6-dehydratase